MDLSEAKKPKEFTGPAARGGERQVDAASGRRHVDAAALKDVLSKNGRRAAVAHLQAAMGLSERRACNLIDAAHPMLRWRSRQSPDTGLRTRLRELANARRPFGN